MNETLTYRQLIDILNAIPEDRKNDTATVRIEMGVNEFFPILKIGVAGFEQDVLDVGHFYLEV